MRKDFHKREEKAEVLGTFSHGFLSPQGKDCEREHRGEGDREGRKSTESESFTDPR